MSFFELILSSNAFSSRELSELLTEEVVLPVGGQFELRPGATSLRSPDQTVLVAVVAGTSAAVSALFTGLLRLVEVRFNRSAKIVLRGTDGTTVEVPVGTSQDELDKFIGIAKRLSAPEVRLVLPPETLGRNTKS